MFQKPTEDQIVVLHTVAGCIPIMHAKSFDKIRKIIEKTYRRESQNVLGNSSDQTFTFVRNFTNFVYSAIHCFCQPHYIEDGKFRSIPSVNGKNDNRRLLTLSSTTAAMGMASKHSLMLSHTHWPRSAPNFVKHSLQ